MGSIGRSFVRSLARYLFSHWFIPLFVFFLRWFVYLSIRLCFHLTICSSKFSSCFMFFLTLFSSNIFLACCFLCYFRPCLHYAGELFGWCENRIGWSFRGYFGAFSVTERSYPAQFFKVDRQSIRQVSVSLFGAVWRSFHTIPSGSVSYRDMKSFLV